MDNINTKSQKLKVVLFSVALLIFVIFWFLIDDNGKQIKSVNLKIGSTEIRAELADTPEKRVRGLSGRVGLGENEGLARFGFAKQNLGGMLFVFDSSSTTSESEVVLDKPGYHGIWMKDMKFAIDILWINSDKKIVDIIENITPDTYPQVFRPKEPASYVVEVNAGLVEKYKIRAGDVISF